MISVIPSIELFTRTLNGRRDSKGLHMLVHRADISATERHDFERAIRANGKDPLAFKAELFEATLAGLGRTLRRVHVATRSAAAQYEASAGRSWTKSFARHLAKGVFG